MTDEYNPLAEYENERDHYEDDLETHELDELAQDRELDFDNGCPCCGDPDGFDGDGCYCRFGDGEESDADE